VHRVTFVQGDGSEAATEEGQAPASLTRALESDLGATGTLRLAHSHAAAETSTAGTKVGELIVDRAVDLLAAPRELGSASFACGAEATEARILVAPPEEADAVMHGGGLFLAGTATPAAGGDPVSFEAVLPVGDEAVVGGLDIDADDGPALVIQVPREGWFDGIDFAALPGGVIAEGSAEGEALAALLVDGGMCVRVEAE
jgi:hypothetical protein